MNIDQICVHPCESVVELLLYFRPMTIRVSVLLFGQARELAGVQETTIDVEGATVGDAVARLEALFPALAPLDRVLLTAVNETYATRGEPIADGDTLAIFPPVSGGEE